MHVPGTQAAIIFLLALWRLLSLLEARRTFTAVNTVPLPGCFNRERANKLRRSSDSLKDANRTHLTVFQHNNILQWPGSAAESGSPNSVRHLRHLRHLLHIMYSHNISTTLHSGGNRSGSAPNPPRSFLNTRNLPNKVLPARAHQPW